MNKIEKIISDSINEVFNQNNSSNGVSSMDFKSREKVVDALSNLIIKIANKKRPTKTELRVLPEVVNSLNHFNKL